MQHLWLPPITVRDHYRADITLMGQKLILNVNAHGFVVCATVPWRKLKFLANR